LQSLAPDDLREERESKIKKRIVFEDEEESPF